MVFYKSAYYWKNRMAGNVQTAISDCSCDDNKKLEDKDDYSPTKKDEDLYLETLMPFWEKKVWYSVNPFTNFLRGPTFEIKSQGHEKNVLEEHHIFYVEEVREDTVVIRLLALDNVEFTMKKYDTHWFTRLDKHPKYNKLVVPAKKKRLVKRGTGKEFTIEYDNMGLSATEGKIRVDEYDGIIQRVGLQKTQSFFRSQHLKSEDWIFDLGFLHQDQDIINEFDAEFQNKSYGRAYRIRRTGEHVILYPKEYVEQLKTLINSETQNALYVPIKQKLPNGKMAIKYSASLLFMFVFLCGYSFDMYNSAKGYKQGLMKLNWEEGIMYVLFNIWIGEYFADTEKGPDRKYAYELADNVMCLKSEVNYNPVRAYVHAKTYEHEEDTAAQYYLTGVTVIFWTWVLVNKLGFNNDFGETPSPAFQLDYFYGKIFLLRVSDMTIADLGFFVLGMMLLKCLKFGVILPMHSSLFYGRSMKRYWKQRNYSYLWKFVWFLTTIVYGVNSITYGMCMGAFFFFYTFLYHVPYFLTKKLGWVVPHVTPNTMKMPVNDPDLSEQYKSLDHRRLFGRYLIFGAWGFMIFISIYGMVINSPLKTRWGETFGDFMFAPPIAALGYWYWYMVSYVKLTSKDGTKKWVGKLISAAFTIVVALAYLAFRVGTYPAVLYDQTVVGSFVLGPLFGITTVNAICCKSTKWQIVTLLLAILFLVLKVYYPLQYNYDNYE